MNKKCCHCKETKSIFEFHKNKSAKDGYSHECKDCKKILKKIYYDKNREDILEAMKIEYYSDINKSRKIKREYAARNRKSENLRAKKWYQNNKEHKQEYDKIYAQGRTKQRRVASKTFREVHPGRKKADTAYRRANRIQATPPWVNRMALRTIYENCPKGFHVDHIIPLKGKGICGLHVPWNLQYLIAEENLRKSNHYSMFER